MQLPAEEVVDRLGQRIEASRWYGDAFPKWFLSLGPGITAGFLGARVMADEDTTWFERAADRPLRDIHPRYDLDNRCWRRVLDLTHEAVERWHRPHPWRQGVRPGTV